jgi:hypothetical protein
MNEGNGNIDVSKDSGLLVYDALYIGNIYRRLGSSGFLWNDVDYYSNLQIVLFLKTCVVISTAVRIRNVALLFRHEGTP